MKTFNEPLPTGRYVLADDHRKRIKQLEKGYDELRKFCNEQKRCIELAGKRELALVQILKNAPIKLLNETDYTFLLRYKKWYRRSRVAFMKKEG